MPSGPGDLSVLSFVSSFLTFCSVTVKVSRYVILSMSASLGIIEVFSSVNTEAKNWFKHSALSASSVILTLL